MTNPGPATAVSSNQVNFTAPAGSIDPIISGFVPGITNRMKVTLSANTSFQGLPAGADGQVLYILIVAGAFTLTLLHLSTSTSQKQISASNDFVYQLFDCAQLFYDSVLSQWILIP